MIKLKKLIQKEWKNKIYKIDDWRKWWSKREKLPFFNQLFDKFIKELIDEKIITKNNNDLILNKNKIENYDHLFFEIKEPKTRFIIKEIFEIIQNNENEISYENILSELKKTITDKKLLKKLSSYLLSHYCRKLYKIGLIEFSNKNKYKSLYSKSNFIEENLITLNKRENIEKSENKEIKFNIENEHNFYFNELNFEENLILNINSFEWYKKFKLNDI